ASDWSSDVCSSDLRRSRSEQVPGRERRHRCSVDVNALRATYDGILRDFDAKVGAILDEAQQEFDALIAAAPTKVITPDKEKDSDSDSDKEEEEDDDDD